MKNFILIVCLVLVYAGCSKNDGSGSSSSSDKLATGASAHDFLSGEVYTTVTIQVEYSPGMQPQLQSINNLISFLQAHLNKASITVTQSPVGSIGKSTVSINDVSSFEDKNRTAFTSGSNMAVCILAVDADYTTPGVAGVAYRNTSLVMLEKTIEAASGGLDQPSRIKIETTVLEHEFGHLLGLVNNGTAMVTPHEDEAHKPHCNNNNCLMYYDIENSGFMSQLGNAVPKLDDNCINDLKNNGGK